MADEQLLAVELASTAALVTLADVSKGQIPKPRQFFAIMLVFAALSGVAQVSADANRLAVGFGGLVLLGAALAQADKFIWLANQLGSGGFQFPQGLNPSGSGPGQGVAN